MTLKLMNMLDVYKLNGGEFKLVCPDYRFYAVEFVGQVYESCGLFHLHHQNSYCLTLTFNPMLDIVNPVIKEIFSDVSHYKSKTSNSDGSRMERSCE